MSMLDCGKPYQIRYFLDDSAIDIASMSGILFQVTIYYNSKTKTVYCGRSSNRAREAIRQDAGHVPTMGVGYILSYGLE